MGGFVLLDGSAGARPFLDDRVSEHVHSRSYLLTSPGVLARLLDSVPLHGTSGRCLARNAPRSLTRRCATVMTRWSTPCCASITSSGELTRYVGNAQIVLKGAL